MESHILNKRGIVRTHGNVFRPNQLPSNLPDYDEYHIRSRNSRTMANSIHGRHGNTHPKTRGRNRRTAHRTTSHIRPKDPLKAPRTQLIPQTRKMHLRTTTNRIPRSNCRPRDGPNGRQESRKGKELATTDKRNRSPKIPGLHRVLPILYPRLLTHRPTTPGLDH